MDFLLVVLSIIILIANAMFLVGTKFVDKKKLLFIVDGVFLGCMSIVYFIEATILEIPVVFGFIVSFFLVIYYIIKFVIMYIVKKEKPFNLKQPLIYLSIVLVSTLLLLGRGGVSKPLTPEEVAQLEKEEAEQDKLDEKEDEIKALEDSLNEEQQKADDLAKEKEKLEKELANKDKDIEADKNKNDEKLSDKDSKIDKLDTELKKKEEELKKKENELKKSEEKLKDKNDKSEGVKDVEKSNDNKEYAFECIECSVGFNRLDYNYGHAEDGIAMCKKCFDTRENNMHNPDLVKRPDYTIDTYGIRCSTESLGSISYSDGSKATLVGLKAFDKNGEFSNLKAIIFIKGSSSFHGGYVYLNPYTQDLYIDGRFYEVKDSKMGIENIKIANSDALMLKIKLKYGTTPYVNEYSYLLF